MKKWQAVVGIVLPFVMLFWGASVFATAPAPSKPSQTPTATATATATATQKADEHTPIAKATEKADENTPVAKATKKADENTPVAKATKKANECPTEGQGGDENKQSNEQAPVAKATKKADECANGGIAKVKRITYKGVVSAVGTDSLTLTLAGGGSKTFHMTSNTRINIPGLGHSATLADIHIGMQALVQVLGNDPTLTALYVTVVTAKPEELHHVGIVTAYTPGASITIQDKHGDSFTFLITPQTEILPKERANQLGIGSLVTIIARRDVTDGPLTAQGIVVHPHATTPKDTPTPTDTPTATPTK